MAAVARRAFLGWLAGAAAAAGLGTPATARPNTKRPRSGAYEDTYSDGYL